MAERAANCYKAAIHGKKSLMSGPPPRRREGEHGLSLEVDTHGTCKKLRPFSANQGVGEPRSTRFLDKLSQSALLFREAIGNYLADGASEEFEEKLKHVNDLESKADHLRRSVETQLYAHTLIPESRGDVLGLMENLDSRSQRHRGRALELLHRSAGDSRRIPTAISPPWRTRPPWRWSPWGLASRAFFRKHRGRRQLQSQGAVLRKGSRQDGHPAQTRDLRLGPGLKPQSPASATSSKVIDNVADMSEDVADRLSIYTIKRTV